MSLQDTKNTGKHTINYRPDETHKNLDNSQLSAQRLIPCNTPLIDSLSIKIQLDQVKVIDKRLTSETSIRYTDLADDEQFDDEVKPPIPLIIIKNGITLRLRLAQIPIMNDKKEKIPTWFIDTVLTAKLLTNDYFLGISLQTIDKLYDFFMSLEVFTCSKDVFLNALPSDVDICINRYIDGFNTFLPIIEHLQNQCGTKKHLTKLYNDPDGQSLMFNQRHNAKPSLPFVKVYNKEKELLNKSSEFWNTYLFNEYGTQIKNLTRIEATIRNYAHKKRLVRFGIIPQFKTLIELLEIPKDDLYRFITFSIESYIEKKTRVKTPNLSPTDHMLFELIQNSVIAGHDFKSILNITNNFTNGKNTNVIDVSRSRMRKKLTDLFDLMIAKDLKIAHKQTQNAHILSYLDFIGVR